MFRLSSVNSLFKLIEHNMGAMHNFTMGQFYISIFPVNFLHYFPHQGPSATSPLIRADCTALGRQKAPNLKDFSQLND